MMTFPIYGKIKHVPNHQPALALGMKQAQLNEDHGMQGLALAGLNIMVNEKQNMHSPEIRFIGRIPYNSPNPNQYYHDYHDQLS